jgi:hypothetical protein
MDSSIRNTLTRDGMITDQRFIGRSRAEAAPGVCTCIHMNTQNFGAIFYTYI